MKLQSEPGHEYMFRERAEGKDAITEIFGNIQRDYADYSQQQVLDVDFAKENLPFAVNFIWATSGIPLPESVAFLMSTRF